MPAGGPPADPASTARATAGSMGIAGHHRRPDSAGDVGAVRLRPVFRHEHDAVGSGQPAGAQQRQIARSSDEQPARRSVSRAAGGSRSRRRRSTRTCRAGEERAQRRPSRRVPGDCCRAAWDEPGRAGDVDGEVEHGPPGASEANQSLSPCPLGSGTPRAAGNSPSRSTAASRPRIPGRGPRRRPSCRFLPLPTNRR